MRTALILFIGCFAGLALAQDTTITLLADGAPALSLRVPKDAKVTATTNHTTITTSKLALYIWTAANAKTPDDALPGVAGLIKTEFTNFKPTSPHDYDC